MEFGLGCEQDFKQAETLYIMAASQNNGLALSRLAFLRKYGRPGIKIDRVEAGELVARLNDLEGGLDWLIMAADKHDHHAGKDIYYCEYENSTFL